MNRRLAFTAAVAALAVLHADVTAGRSKSTGADGVERHHYRVGARVRPLLLFWISRSNIGDAFATRSLGPEGSSYSLLIGSDPDRAPLRINRWGYIEEETRGAAARLVGLMTESDEDSIEEAEANVRRPPAGRHPFRVIQATIERDQSHSRVASLAAPQDFTFRQLRSVQDLGIRDSDWTSRTVRLPPDVRAGFLTALAETMHSPSAAPVRYVYYGRLYELRRTQAVAIPNLKIAGVPYGPAIAGDYLITSLHDGERTRFSMTYGVRPPFAEVPLRVTYQPRWWMQLELSIDDGPDVLPSAEGARR
jgi:hypothetical protein